MKASTEATPLTVPAALQEHWDAARPTEEQIDAVVERTASRRAFEILEVRDLRKWKIHPKSRMARGAFRDRTALDDDVQQEMNRLIESGEARDLATHALQLANATRLAQQRAKANEFRDREARRFTCPICRQLDQSTAERKRPAWAVGKPTKWCDRCDLAISLISLERVAESLVDGRTRRELIVERLG